MSEKLIPVDISSSPDLTRLVEEIERSGVGRLLHRGDEPVAVVQPLPKNGKSAAKRHRLDSEHDPVLELIGMFNQGEPTDIANLKDQYLADAILRREG